MKKFFIPPVFVISGVIILVLLNLCLEEYNKISYPINLIGILVGLTGLWVFGIAVRLFKKNKTTLELKTPNHFVQEGIYRFTRNPIYLGMMLFLLGLAVWLQNIFGLVVPVVFVGIIIKRFIPKEEILMEEIFGTEYLDYKKRVRRWI